MSASSQSWARVSSCWWAEVPLHSLASRAAVAVPPPEAQWLLASPFAFTPS